MTTFIAIAFIIATLVVTETESWIFDCKWPFRICGNRGETSTVSNVSENFTIYGNSTYTYTYTRITQNASNADTDRIEDTTITSDTYFGNKTEENTTNKTSSVGLIKKLRDITNISELENIVEGLDSSGLSENDEIQVIQGVLNYGETLLTSAATTLTWDSETWTSLFDTIKRKYLDRLDTQDIEAFIKLSTNGLVANLETEGGDLNKNNDAVLKIEEYVVAAAFILLNSDADGETQISFNLKNLDIFACKGKCAMKSEFAEFDPMEYTELTYTFLEHKNLPENEGSTLTSHVVSVTAQDNEKEVVSIPVHFVLKHSEGARSSDTQCGFLDHSRSQWSTYGCEKVFSNVSHTECACNHTTNFAILLMHSDVQLTAEDEFWFDIMTYVGCGVSITALIATMTTFVVLGLQRTQRVIVLLHLCFCLCSAQLVLVAGTTAKVGTPGCKLIAILLHFFFTASFSWMLMEGVYLYMKASNARGGKLKFRIIIAAGWSIPATIVMIAVASGFNEYGTGKGCWLSVESGFIWVFIGPAIGIISINCIVLAFVIHVFLGLKSVSKTSDRERIKRATKAVLLLMPLLGITWIFGLLAFDAATKWFLYLFCICNSLQGLAIFILQCARNDDVRKAFFRKYRRSFVSIGSYTSSSGSSSNKTRDSYLNSEYISRAIPTVAKW